MRPAPSDGAATSAATAPSTQGRRRDERTRATRGKKVMVEAGRILPNLSRAAGRRATPHRICALAATVARRGEAREHVAMPSPRILRIAFTGGPCGGKTTAIEHVGRVLESSGFRVLRVPEAAHLVLSGGGSIEGLAG